jgi:hypothetical protein
MSKWPKYKLKRRRAWEKCLSTQAKNVYLHFNTEISIYLINFYCIESNYNTQQLLLCCLV